MRERSAMLASVTFAFVLIAGLVLQSTLSADAEDCIAKPNAPAPQGEHWYYRIDHANNRQCWRLGPEGLRVQKSAPQIEKEIAPAAAVQPPEPARARRPETTGSSVAAAARAEAAPEPNPASAVSSLPFLDTPRMPDLPPSVQPAPQPEPVKRTQTASALDTVPAEDNSASSNVSDAPAANSVAEPPRQAAARPSAPPAPATDMEIDHTFAFLMIVFAVLAVAGPTLHYAERRRRREEEETANYESPRWARVVTPNTPTPRVRVPLQPNLAADRRPPPIPPTPADQTERLAQALQQLVDRLHTQPRPEPSVTATRPAERTDVEMMRGRRPIALRN